MNPRAISSETLGPTLGGTIEIVNEKGYRGLRVKQHAASSTRNARSIWAVAGFQDVVHASRRCSQRQLENTLEQARFEAGRAHRQYDEVDPANRLVAGELERRWNERLEKCPYA